MPVDETTQDSLLTKMEHLLDRKLAEHSQGVRSEIENVRGDIGLVRNEVIVIKENIREEIGTMRAEMEFFKSEMGGFKNEISSMVTNATEINNKQLRKEVKEEIGELERKVNEKLAKYDEKMESFEIFKRKKNLIIHGLGKLSSYEERENALCKLFKVTMRVEFEKSEIEFIQKLNRNREDGAILVGLRYNRKKEEILHNRAALKGTKIYLDHDYSPAMSAKRKDLRDVISGIKGKFSDNKIFMKHDKIQIDGVLYTHEQALEWERNKCKERQGNANDNKNKRSYSEMEIVETHNPSSQATGLSGTPTAKKGKLGTGTPTQNKEVKTPGKGKAGNVAQVQSKLNDLWGKKPDNKDVDQTKDKTQEHT